MTQNVLERTQLIARPKSEVFPFFADAMNLERITPSYLHFYVTTPQPIAMATGTRIAYRLSLFGIPFRWRTVITDFTPETRFIDEQEKGPYSRWVHTHTFEEVAGGTEMHDHVLYEPPLGPLGAIANQVFIARTLAQIFDYRRDSIASVFKT